MMSLLPDRATSCQSLIYPVPKLEKGSLSKSRSRQWVGIASFAVRLGDSADLPLIRPDNRSVITKEGQ